MNEVILICSFGIGIVAGLRSMTAPAVVSWTGHVGWLGLSNGPFWFMATVPAVLILTPWSLFELVIDKTSKIGNRTELLGLGFRIVTSSFSGAAVSSAAGADLAIGMVSGLFGGMIGTFGGYYLRRACVRNSTLGDLPIAIGEDIIAIGLGAGCVYIAGGFA